MKAHDQRARARRVELVAEHLPPLRRPAARSGHSQDPTRYQMLGHYRPYTAEEWDLLADFPVLVGVCVALADDSGRGGTERELDATAPAYFRLARAHPRNALIQRLLTLRAEQAIAQRARALAAKRSGDEVLAQTLARAAEVSALLAHKSPPREAREYKEFAAAVGEAVAEAAKEGGWLRHVNYAVSTQERATIFQIAAALGLGTPAPERDDRRLGGRGYWSRAR